MDRDCSEENLKKIQIICMLPDTQRVPMYISRKLFTVLAEKVVFGLILLNPHINLRESQV